MPGLSTAPLAAEERRAVLGADAPTLRVRDVIRAVCAEFGVPARHVLSVRRTAPIALARQVAMHLAREVTGQSLPFIGRVFERDHTTVLHADRVVRDRCTEDVALARRVAALRDALTARPGEPA